MLPNEPPDATDPLRTTDRDPDEATAAATPAYDLTATQLSGRPTGSEQVAASVSIPGYEIDGILGRGGMGVVYKARDLTLKRTVALKMILAGGYAGPHQLARFRVEAEAVARLQHPNIVQIHEVGEAGGHPYCSLEFIEGGNLASALHGKPMVAHAAAKLVETLARAMQLAHSRNVVHRDLKPANILLTADGTPKITDFGLARQLDSDSGETQAGAVMGTPSYMAPEQASGRAHEAGPAADVYALGAILYDCLTGRPPFKGSTVVETLDQVRTQEPMAPSRRQAGVPLDLETICLKCLRKEPENRYPSAAALADELSRFQQGLPILARPVGRVERGIKWVKRNPAVAASLAGLVASIVGAFVLVLGSFLDAESARKAELKQREEAQENERAERWGRYRSNISAASAALQLQNSGAARSALEDAPDEHRAWEWHYFHSQLDGAHRVLAVPGGGAQLLVLSPSGRQFAVSCLEKHEVYLFDAATGKLESVLRGHTAPVVSIVYHPQHGKQLATAATDSTIRFWDPATGRQTALVQTHLAEAGTDRFPVLTYNSDGSRLASAMGWNPNATNGAAGLSFLLDVSSGSDVTVVSKWNESFGHAAFSPNGRRMAVATGTSFHFCESLTGRTLAVAGPHLKSVDRVAFSSDGKRIASTQAYSSLEGEGIAPETRLEANAVHLWEGETGRKVAVLRGHRSHVQSILFSPDGSRLVSGGAFPDNTVRLWDAVSGKLMSDLVGHKNSIYTLAFSPDGKRLVTGSIDKTARLWDARSGQLRAVLSGHTGQIRHVLFSPDGSRAVTASEDATLRLWNSDTGDLVGVLRGHGDGFNWQCPPVFTLDGSRLVSGSTDGTVRIWDMSLVERNGILSGHGSYVYDVAFDPNGERVASAAWDGTARQWDATTGRQTGLLKHETAMVNSVSYSRDGSRLATLERHRGVKLWDAATNHPAREAWFVPSNYLEGARAALNPAGTLLAAGTTSGPARLWSAGKGRELAQLDANRNRVIDVAFDPDGRQLATTGSDGSIGLWDVATHSAVADLRGHDDIVWRVAFSANGQLLASGSNDKTICLWDMHSHERLKVIPVGSVVYCVAFSPDGTRLAAGCRDNTIRLFDVARRQQVAELRGHTDYVHAVAWSPDGTRLVSGSGDFTVRIWDSLTVQERAKRVQPDFPGRRP